MFFRFSVFLACCSILVFVIAFELKNKVLAGENYKEHNASISVSKFLQDLEGDDGLRKLKAIRSLRNIGDPLAADALIKVITDENKSLKVRLVAREALSRLHGADVDFKLLGLLGNAEFQKRQPSYAGVLITSLLGARGVKSAVPNLMAMFASFDAEMGEFLKLSEAEQQKQDGDRVYSIGILQANIIAALAEIKTPEAISFIINQSGRPQLWRVKIAINAVLLRLKDPLYLKQLKSIQWKRPVSECFESRIIMLNKSGKPFAGYKHDYPHQVYAGEIPSERNFFAELNYFSDWVYRTLKKFPEIKLCSKEPRKLYVWTTLDAEKQIAAHSIIQSSLQSGSAIGKVPEISLFSMDKTGAVRVLIGGNDYGRSKFNRVLQKRDASELCLTEKVGSGRCSRSLFALTSSYGAVANQGNIVRPYAILKITDHAGRLVYDRHNEVAKKIYGKEYLSKVNSAMIDKVADAGSTMRIRSGISAHDYWTVGFTDQRVTGLRIGYDDESAVNQKIWRPVSEKIWDSFLKLSK